MNKHFVLTIRFDLFWGIRNNSDLVICSHSVRGIPCM